MKLKEELKEAAEFIWGAVLLGACAGIAVSVATLIAIFAIRLV